MRDTRFLMAMFIDKIEQILLLTRDLFEQGI